MEIHCRQIYFYSYIVLFADIFKFKIYTESRLIKGELSFVKNRYHSFLQYGHFFIIPFCLIYLQLKYKMADAAFLLPGWLYEDSHVTFTPSFSLVALKVLVIVTVIDLSVSLIARIEELNLFLPL